MSGETIEGRFAEAKPAAADGTIWAERTPLPPALPDAPSLPPDLIPDVLRPWLLDITERAQIPLEFVAAPAVVGLSSIIGRTIGIYPKERDDWLVVPNLWGMIIGRPGSLKSPAISEALKPLYRLAEEAQERHQADGAAADAEADIIKMRMSVLRDRGKTAAKNDDQDELTRVQADLAALNASLDEAVSHERRHVVNDGTVEKIGELLKHNPHGLLLCRDELSGLLRSLDKVGREGDREFYLEAWNGNGSYTYDRIGRGTLHVPALTLSIIGTIQPGKLQSYIDGALSGGSGDDGLLQRFQVVVWPEVSGEWRNVDRWPNTDAKNRAFAVFRALDELDPLGIGAVTDDGIPALRFSGEAQELFNEWRAGLEARLRAEEMVAFPAFESHLAKYRSLMPSLALIFYLVERVGGDDRVGEADVVGAVTLAAAQNAADWCEFLEAHARKVYAAEIQPDITSAHALAEKIKVGAIWHGCTVREIYRHQWSGLTASERVWSGLKLLRQRSWLRITEKDTGGRRTEIIEIHPDLRKVAA